MPRIELLQRARGSSLGPGGGSVDHILPVVVQSKMMYGFSLASVALQKK